MDQERGDGEHFGWHFALCLKEWPVLRPYVPDGATPLKRGFGKGNGACTSAAAAEDLYVHSRGGPRFLANDAVPDGFFWSGIVNGGGSEYLFAMWRVGHRRFWFYDKISNYYGEPGRSFMCTARRLQTALRRWDEGEAAVIYSGIWGWWVPEANDFVKDIPSLREILDT